jgi:hypothetical protein
MLRNKASQPTVAEPFLCCSHAAAELSVFECSRQFTAGDSTECCLLVNTATPREITISFYKKI